MNNSPKNQEDPQEKLKNEQIEREQVRKHSKEMWLTNMFVERPFIVMILVIVTAIICSIISIALDGFKMAEKHDREYMIWDNQRVKDFDMFAIMRKAFLKG